MALDWRMLAPRLHFAGCLAMMTVTVALVFSPTGQPLMQPFVMMPVIAWAALRFTWRGTLPALGIMLAGATVGANPYDMRIAEHSTAVLILAQALAVAGGFGMVLAAITAIRRRSEARLRDLMATVDLGVFMTRELAGKILFWSKGAERLYGWTAAEAVGRISHDLLQTVHPVPLAEIEAAVMTKGEWTGDLRHVTKDKRCLIVSARKVRRDLANGRIITLLEVIHNVTAERADQAALRDLNSTLEIRIEAEVAIREQTQSRVKNAHTMRALGSVAAGVAHEFNNILQGVVGSLELIAQRPDDAARVARFSGIAMGAADRGSIITSRLLGFAGRTAFHVERVEIGLLMDALRDVLVHTLGGRVSVCLDLEPVLPTLLIDKSELETALINLATNARDAMPDGGTVTLAAGIDTVVVNPDAPPERSVWLAVRDHGVGMDAITAQRAVEPFFTTKDVGKGTGLGLSMAKGFAEQSGGRLAIESTLGEGTTVTLWLPLGAEELPALTRSVRPADVQPSVLIGRRVLFVDDEAMVRETLAFGLEMLGYTLIAAKSGTEALAVLDAGTPVDILVSDYAMPMMDGLMLIAEARARRPALPAMVLTGYVETIGQDATETQQAAALHVLRKPISAAQLANSIEAMMVLRNNGHETS